MINFLPNYTPKKVSWHPISKTKDLSGGKIKTSLHNSKIWIWNYIMLNFDLDTLCRNNIVTMEMYKISVRTDRNGFHFIFILVYITIWCTRHAVSWRSDFPHISTIWLGNGWCTDKPSNQFHPLNISLTAP